MTVEIHLVLQGGGAKFFCLVAALAELQELERVKQVRVRSVTGTSAGAIAGALYAMRVPMDDVRDWLKHSDRERLLRQLVPRPMLLTLLKMVLGIPLISPSVLDDALRQLFALATPAARLDQELIGDFRADRGRIAFHSLYTDLRNNSVIRHGDETFLLQALRESAGLPFVLRTYRSKEPDRVDGGICENLPAGFYPDGDPAPVVALAFRKDAHPVGGLLNYAKSLLFTAIDHSVTRAKSALEPGHVFEIATEITTLDFDKILAHPNDEEYAALRRSVGRFFRGFIVEKERVEALGGDPWLLSQRSRSPWARDYAEYMRDLGEIYNKQWGRDKLPGRLARLEFHFVVNDVGLPVLDTMKYVRVFSGTGGPLHVTKVELESTVGASIGAQTVALSKKDDALEFRRTPIYESLPGPGAASGHLKRPILVWPLGGNETLLGDFILEVVTPGKGLMPPLAEGAIEELLIDTSPFLGTVETVEIYAIATLGILERLSFHTLDEAEDLGYAFQHPDTVRPNWRPQVIGSVRRFAGQAEAVSHAKALEIKLGVRLGSSKSLVRWHAHAVAAPAIVGILIRYLGAVDGLEPERDSAARIAGRPSG